MICTKDNTKCDKQRIPLIEMTSATNIKFNPTKNQVNQL